MTTKFDIIKEAKKEKILTISAITSEILCLYGLITELPIFYLPLFLLPSLTTATIKIIKIWIETK